MIFDTLEEFQEYFWNYINDNVVSNADINMNNKDFCDSVCYDAYRIYKQGDISIDVICKLSESILFNVYRFKPILGV